MEGNASSNFDTSSSDWRGGRIEGVHSVSGCCWRRYTGQCVGILIGNRVFRVFGLELGFWRGIK